MGRKYSCHVVSHDLSHCSVTIAMLTEAITGSRRVIRDTLLGGRVSVYLI